MHGNPLKLIWLLNYLGLMVFKNPREQFSKLLAFYQLPPQSIDKKVIDEFYELLDSAQFHPDSTKGLILIGDLLADRGRNDYFMRDTPPLNERIHSSWGFL